MAPKTDDQELIRLILQEHSLSQTKTVLRFVGRDKQRFATLLRCACAKDKTLAQRASWALGHCMVTSGKWLHPHFPLILKTLSQPATHPAVYRNLLRLLQNYPVPDASQAPLFDRCLHLLHKATEPVAIRVFAMSTAANLASAYPELKRELAVMLKELMSHPQSAGMISRAKKVLWQIAS